MKTRVLVICIILCSTLLMGSQDDYKYYINLKITLEQTFKIDFSEEFDLDDAKDYGSYYKVNYIPENKINKIKYFSKNKLVWYYKFTYSKDNYNISIYNEKGKLINVLTYDHGNQLIKKKSDAQITSTKSKSNNLLPIMPYWTKGVASFKIKELVNDFSFAKLLIHKNVNIDKSKLESFTRCFFLVGEVDIEDTYYFSFPFLFIFSGQFKQDDAEELIKDYLQSCYKLEKRSDKIKIYYSHLSYRKSNHACILVPNKYIILCPDKLVDETVDLLMSKDENNRIQNKHLYKKIETFNINDIGWLWLSGSFLKFPDRKRYDVAKDIIYNIDHLSLSISLTDNKQYLLNTNLVSKSFSTLEKIKLLFNLGKEVLINDVKNNKNKDEDWLTFDINEVHTKLLTTKLKKKNDGSLNISFCVDKLFFRDLFSSLDHTLYQNNFVYFLNRSSEQHIKEAKEHANKDNYLKALESLDFLRFNISNIKKEHKDLFNKYLKNLDIKTKNDSNYKDINSLEEYLITSRFSSINKHVKEKRYKWALVSSTYIYFLFEDTKYAKSIKQKREEIYQLALASEKGSNYTCEYLPLNTHLKLIKEWRNNAVIRNKVLIKEANELVNKYKDYNGAINKIFEISFFVLSPEQRQKVSKLYDLYHELRMLKYNK